MIERGEIHGRWPKVAAVAAPLTTGAWLAAREQMPEDARWRMAAWPVLLWHQTEEWVWPAGFLEWFNPEVLGSSEELAPLTPRIGVFVNVPFGWGLSLLVSAFGDRQPALPIALCSSHVGNAILHLGWAARNRRWDPGAVTSAVTLLPWSLAGLRSLLGSGGAPARDQVCGLAFGAATAVGLMSTLRRRVRH
jgi:Protein of unknown function with HXXEE motif